MLQTYKLYVIERGPGATQNGRYSTSAWELALNPSRVDQVDFKIDLLTQLRTLKLAGTSLKPYKILIGKSGNEGEEGGLYVVLKQSMRAAFFLKPILGQDQLPCSPEIGPLE